MREHYHLDGLADYCIEAVPETTRVVNPPYRTLDGQVRSKAGLLRRKLAEFGALNLEGEIEPKPLEAFQQKKAEIQESIAHLQPEVGELKGKRKGVKQHITLAELPAEARFQRLSTPSKHFIDTIKMIAYRAEAAMAYVLRGQMARFDDARSLLRAIYSTEVDLLPNEPQGTLTVRLHHLANHSSDQAIRHLCAELNATETPFPGTNLRLLYELVSSQNP